MCWKCSSFSISAVSTMKPRTKTRMRTKTRKIKKTKTRRRQLLIWALTRWVFIDIICDVEHQIWRQCFQSASFYNSFIFFRTNVLTIFFQIVVYALCCLTAGCSLQVFNQVRIFCLHLLDDCRKGIFFLAWLLGNGEVLKRLIFPTPRDIDLLVGNMIFVFWRSVRTVLQTV